MIEYLKRWLFARAVCKSMGAEFSLLSLLPKDVGSCEIVSWRFQPEGAPMRMRSIAIRSTIRMDRFYETLAHEIGHLIDHKVEHYGYGKRDHSKFTGVPDDVTTRASGEQANKLLYSELRASRCARLLLKSWGRLEEDSMDYLNKCYGTYLTGYGSEGAAAVSYHGMKYLKAVK